MRPPRSSARINLRFHNLEEMDAIELQANKDGLDLQNWLRWLVRQEMEDRQFKRLLLVDGVKSLLTTQYLLEQLVDEQKVRNSKERAEKLVQNLNLQAKQL